MLRLLFWQGYGDLNLASPSISNNFNILHYFSFMDNELSRLDSGAVIRDGCESESRIRWNLNFKIRGCVSEHGYGCVYTAKIFQFYKNIFMKILKFLIL